VHNTLFEQEKFKSFENKMNIQIVYYLKMGKYQQKILEYTNARIIIAELWEAKKCG